MNAVQCKSNLHSSFYYLASPFHLRAWALAWWINHENFQVHSPVWIFCFFWSWQGVTVRAEIVSLNWCSLSSWTSLPHIDPDEFCTESTDMLPDMVRGNSWASSYLQYLFSSSAWLSALTPFLDRSFGQNPLRDIYLPCMMFTWFTAMFGWWHC